MGTLRWPGAVSCCAHHRPGDTQSQEDSSSVRLVGLPLGGTLISEISRDACITSPRYNVMLTP